MEWPTCVPIDDVPSVLEVEEAVRCMANTKAVGPDDSSAELTKLCLDGDHFLFWKCRFVIVVTWQLGEVPQQWKDTTLKVLNKKKDLTE